MKFTVDRTTLSEALSVVGKVITGKNGILPILDNYRLEIFDTACNITASNGSVFISKQIELISSTDDANICIDAITLKELISKLDDKSIDLEVLKNEDTGEIVSVLITAGGNEYKVFAESSEFYLKVSADEKVSYDMDGKVFMEAISAAKEFLNTRIDRVFQHLLIEMGNGVKVVGTDSHRVMSKEVSKNTVNVKRLLINKADAGIISGIKCEENISLSYGDSSVKIDMGNGVKVSCRLQDNSQSYPDISLFVPKEFVGQITVPAFNLKRAISRAKIFQDSCLIKIAAGSSDLNISAENRDTGQSCNDVVSCDYSGSDDFIVRVNSEYLLSILSNIKTDNVSIFVGKNYEMPIVFLEEDRPSAEFLMLIMPIRLED